MNSYEGKRFTENWKMAKVKKDLSSNKIISTILRISSSVSIFLMAFGLGLFLLKNNDFGSVSSYHGMGFRNALTGARDFNPLALMNLGIVVLLATPFLRVMGAIFSFLVVDNDRKYTLVSLGVLIIITLSLFIPGLKG